MRRRLSELQHEDEYEIVDNVETFRAIDQSNDIVSKLLSFWREYSSLLSNVEKNAGMEGFSKLDEAKYDSQRLVVPWGDLIKQIDAFQSKLDYCVNNDFIKLTYEKSERLFLLSDMREHSVLSFRDLIADLKNTEKPSQRYTSLSLSIRTLFNSVNTLLRMTTIILEDAGHPARTGKVK
jgi:hypothetical protein